MTMWLPDLDSFPGPKYLALADAIAGDVLRGRLRSGSRLPTHRELARRLGVTIGTVTRGYAEARRRGFLTGQVGRGTFIRIVNPGELPAEPGTRRIPKFVDLSFNIPSVAASEDFVREALARAARLPNLSSLLQYQPHAGLDWHRATGAKYLSSAGLPATLDDVVIACGAQQAMLLTFSAIAEPGDLVLAEELTYAGLKALSRFLRLRLEAVAMDSEGLRPDALADACRRSKPKAVYCTPTLQNPTARLMGAVRRREIANVVREHGLTIVEDDIYGFLLEDRPPPLVSFAPERGYYFTSLSKCIAPALRVGFLRTPERGATTIVAAMMATTHMASPLTAEVGCSLIEDGSLRTIVARERREIAARQKIARRVLGDHVSDTSHHEASHLWVVLPEPWRAEELATHARERGVGVASAEVFAVGRSAVPHAIRLSLSAAADAGALEHALLILRQLLSAGPPPAATGV